MEIQTGNQLKGYIQREIKAHPMHSNYGYNYYFCRNFLDKLFKNGENFALSGSISQFASLGIIKRPITDIDIVTFDSVENAKDMIEGTLKTDKDIKYEIKQRFVTTNSTINYRVMCHFDHLNHLISFDLRKSKSPNSNYETKELPVLFSLDKSFDVNTSSLESHLAKKLYIALLHTYLNQKLGRDVRRFKDFFDIHTILNYGDFDIDKVISLFKSNVEKDEFLSSYKFSSTPFDKNFVIANQTLWDAEGQKKGFDKDISFEDSVESANEFMGKHM